MCSCCWIWRALHCCAYLLFLPFSFYLPLSPSIIPLHFLSQSLCLFLSVTNLHHLPVSNFQFFPSLSLFTRCRSLSLSFFHTFPTVSLERSPLFLSLPPLLCLAYFRHHPPASCFLLCARCLFRITLCSSKRMNPYTCQHGRQHLFPLDHLGEWQIYTFTQVRTPTRACLHCNITYDLLYNSSFNSFS